MRHTAHRHCEAPVSPRYVGRYRREAIQCRGDNIRPTCLSIAGFYVNPGLLRRVSLTTYRKCGGGFAKTGRAYALPCPGAMRRDGGRGYVRALREVRNHTAAYGGTPPKRGLYGGEGGFE
ncbi:MAG: hypothetical protein LBM98_12740, partial [Oscillospiraceae bacterium]|nr:hypothetical protein [Oscillospiraceae bacterium]